jgi:hypothetical protein
MLFNAVVQVVLAHVRLCAAQHLSCTSAGA